MPTLAEVQGLLAGWWFDYDQGNFDAWPRYFAEDADFSCRSDSQSTPFEEFVTADVRGCDEVLAWNRNIAPRVHTRCVTTVRTSISHSLAKEPQLFGPTSS